MKKEDKELLLKDLCARLTYNPMVEYKGETYNVLGITHGRLVLCKPFMSYTLDECPIVKEVKPYLFPLSNMTEEQKEEYRMVCELDTEILSKHPMDGSPFPALYNSQDWLNAHHFDYRGLIEKGLAIDATELNIY